MVRWGILGASKFAREHMAPAIHRAAASELVALGTSSRGKAAPFLELQPQLAVYEDYDALLAAPDVDAVYVPLPHTLHVEWGIKALEAGKHVLVEKPTAMKAIDIDPLIAKRDETGLMATEAYMIVHHPQWQKARDLVHGGAIGTLGHVEGVFTYNNAEDTGNIRNKAETGGGALPDIGVYTYGSTLFVTGQMPEEITHADLDMEGGVDLTARVSARFDGFTAHWVNSMRLHPYQEMVFHGDQGWLRLTAPFNPMAFGEAHIELRNGAGEQHFRFPSAWHYQNQVEAFCRAVESGAQYPWTLEDARRTQEVIDAVYAKAGAR